MSFSNGIKDALFVGYEEIDLQHQTLFKIIEDLMVKECDMQQVISALIDYATFHFSEEERLWKQKGLAKLEEHQKEHQSFFETVNLFQKQLLHNNLTVDEVGTFLMEWLMYHIMEIDMNLRT